MSERPAPAETLVSEGTARRRALHGLAADMLTLLQVTSEDHWRSLTWQEGGATYVLNRGDSAQLQTQETTDHTNWLHVIDSDGEHAAYSLGEDEFAAPDYAFDALADAVNRQATRTLYALAAERLSVIVPGTALDFLYAGQRVVVNDFTQAEYDPFILVKVGETHNSVTYDLTQELLHFTDPHTHFGPVEANEPNEAHVQWLLCAMASGNSYGADRPDSVAPQIPQSTEGQEHTREALHPENVAEIHDFMRRIEAREHSAALLVSRRGRTVVVRTSFAMPYFSRGEQDTKNIPIAFGIVYDGQSLHAEVIPVDGRIDLGFVFNVDLKLNTANAHGTGAGTTISMQGDFAFQQLFEYCDVLGARDSTEDLRVCTPVVAGRFKHATLKTV